MLMGSTSSKKRTCVALYLLPTTNSTIKVGTPNSSKAKFQARWFFCFVFSSPSLARYLLYSFDCFCLDHILQLYGQLVYNQLAHTLTEISLAPAELADIIIIIIIIHEWPA